jgi:hypothetical protein
VKFLLRIFLFHHFVETPRGVFGFDFRDDRLDGFFGGPRAFLRLCPIKLSLVGFGFRRTGCHSSRIDRYLERVRELLCYTRSAVIDGSHSIGNIFPVQDLDSSHVI